MGRPWPKLKEAPMSFRPRSVFVFASCALALAALIAGCGSQSSTAPASVGGASSATGFTQGVITGFGTIHLGRGVNERVFHTEGAELTRYDDGVTHNGTGDDAQMFRAGMKVKIYCDKDDSTRASRVLFIDDLEGPITAKPSATAGATFDVLTVPVLVDANTHFDRSFTHSGLTLDSLEVGNVLELSGSFDANGILHATFIEAEHASPMGQTFEIKGLVENLAGAAPSQTFTVHGASFTTDMNTRIDLMGGLRDSAFVQVKTQSTTTPFLATQVKDLFADGDGDHGEHGDHDGDFHRGGHQVEKASVEGFVSALSGTSPNFSFTLDTKHVVTSSATRGLELVAPNAHIEARGLVDSTGTIVAAKISREDD
jgi:hypothetical protein